MDDGVSQPDMTSRHRLDIFASGFAERRHHRVITSSRTVQAGRREIKS
jgi:hypothetical protein